MTAPKGDFSFLNDTFHTWLNSKLKFYFDMEEQRFYGEQHKFLLQELGLSENDFYLRFLKPYEGLSSEQLIKVAQIQTELGKKYINTTNHFMVKPVLEQYANAIEWTVLNIFDLKLEGLNVKSEDEDPNFEGWLKEPLKQCRYCGRPHKDPRGHEFGFRQLKRCATENITNMPFNCSAIWAAFSKDTREKAREKPPIKCKQYFTDKCEERFAFNLKNAQWTIGTENNAPALIGTFLDAEKSYV